MVEEGSRPSFRIHRCTSTPLICMVSIAEALDKPFALSGRIFTCQILLLKRSFQSVIGARQNSNSVRTDDHGRPLLLDLSADSRIKVDEPDLAAFWIRRTNSQLYLRPQAPSFQGCFCSMPQICQPAPRVTSCAPPSAIS